MRNVAGVAMGVASAFLAVVAVLIGSPALFYITTGLLATLGVCRVQAHLSVRGLRFDRVAPASVRVGDLVTVEITVWSERRIRRPLITIQDNLPQRLLLTHRSPSLPIAPAYDLPIRTQYQFRPLRRGRYRWTGLTVEGTDALGLVTKRKVYETDPAEITVLPSPIPVSLELPTAAGWGISEAQSGQSRGAGLDLYGVRNYVAGDSVRQVHWRSTARTGNLMTKEFEAGSHAAAAFVIQRTRGSDVGQGAATTLEAMCGHTVFLAESFLRQGARVEFPALEAAPSRVSPTERVQEIYELLAGVQADQEATVGTEVLGAGPLLTPGSVVFALIAAQDVDLPGAAMELRGRGIQVVALVYDTTPFERRHTRTKLPSAADPAYLETLRGAGVQPIVMPVEGVANGA